MDSVASDDQSPHDLVIVRAFTNALSTETLTEDAYITTDNVQYLSTDIPDCREDDCYEDPAVLEAVKMIEECPRDLLRCLCPNSILSIFAMQLEEVAKAKSKALKSIENFPEPYKTTQKRRMQERQSLVAKSVIQRLLILLQAALLAGCPSISVHVSQFPCPPPAPTCDLDLVWTSIKNFASAWMPVWSPEVHHIYHPAFKEAVKLFILASTARGINVSNRRRIYLNSALVERIVQHMAENQEDWVSIANH